MKRKILIATHGKLASRFKDALKIIIGDNENITVLNAFSQVENPKDEIKSFLENLTKEDELLVFTDLMGGSVNQMLMQYLHKYNMHLITGINLPLLCQLMLSENITEQVILDSIEMAKKEIKYVNKEVEQQMVENNQSCEDVFLS